MYRTHLEKLTRTRLDDILVAEGVLDRERLEAAQAEQDQTGAQLSDVLIDSGTLDEWDIAKLVATHYALPFVDVKLYSIQPAVLDLLPLDWCRQNSLLPLDQFGKTLAIACVELPTHELVQEVTQRTGCTPFLYVGLRRPMRDVIDETMKRRTARPAKGAAAPAPAPKAEEPAPVVPDDLPRISLQLHGGSASRRPAVERVQRPAPAVPAAPAVPSVPMVAKSSPMQQLLGRKTSVPDAAPAAPAPAARQEEVPRPRLASRAAPVLPAAPAAGQRAGANGEWESIFDMGEDAVRRSSQGGDGGPAPKR